MNRENNPFKPRPDSVLRLSRQMSLSSRLDALFCDEPTIDWRTDLLQLALCELDSPLGVLARVTASATLACWSLDRIVWDRRTPASHCVVQGGAGAKGSWQILLGGPPTLLSTSHVLPPLGRQVSCSLRQPIIFQGQRLGGLVVAGRTSGYGGAEVEALRLVARRIAPTMAFELERERRGIAERRALAGEAQLRLNARSADLPTIQWRPNQTSSRSC